MTKTDKHKEWWVCVWRKEVIITEGSRGSRESEVFEQRRELSPVVQSCKRVDTSEEMKVPTVKKKRQTSNLWEKNLKYKKNPYSLISRNTQIVWPLISLISASENSLRRVNKSCTSLHFDVTCVVLSFVTRLNSEFFLLSLSLKEVDSTLVCSLYKPAAVNIVHKHWWGSNKNIAWTSRETPIQQFKGKTDLTRTRRE